MARPFKDARYPGVSSRIKNGKLVYRYRGKGMPEIRLPGRPGDPEFEAAYEKATQGQGQKAVIIDLTGRALPRTFGHAARRLETMEWLDFDEATQQKNARLIERFLTMRVDPAYPLTWRDTPVEHLDADRLRAIVESVFATNRTVAKHMLVAIKKLLWVTTDVEKWIKPQDDPSLSIRVRIPNRLPIRRGRSPFAKSSRRAIRSVQLRAPATRSASGSATDAATSPHWNGTIWSPRRSNYSMAHWR